MGIISYASRLVFYGGIGIAIGGYIGYHAGQISVVEEMSKDKYKINLPEDGSYILNTKEGTAKPFARELEESEKKSLEDIFEE